MGFYNESDIGSDYESSDITDLYDLGEDKDGV